MGKKRRKPKKTKKETKTGSPRPAATSSSIRSRAPTLPLLLAGAALVAIVASLFLGKSLLRERPSVPAPELANMEPQVAERIEAVRQEVLDDPFSGAAWGKLGMVFQAHELEREAALAYQQAMGFEPDDFRWPYLLAQVEKTLDPERAFAAVRRALELEAHFPPLHVLQAQLHEQRNEPVEAMAAYRRALSVDGDVAVAELGVGRLLLADGDVRESLSHLERAASLAPDSGSVMATLARAYRRSGDTEKALMTAERARDLHPNLILDDRVMAAVSEEAVSVVGYQTRARNAEQAGDRLKAESYLRRMIALRPGEADLHYNLANNLSRQGRMSEAAEAHAKAIELDPGHVSALINLGIIKSRDGELLEAKELYQKALLVEPLHPGALSSLGKVLALEGDLEGAAELFSKALAVEPRRADTHYALAQVLYRQRKARLAVEHFSKALALTTERGDIHTEIAVAYASLGEFESAWAHVQEARKLGAPVPPRFIAALRSEMPEPAAK